MPRRGMIVVLLGALLMALLVAACATVPLTGRRQLSLIPDSQMNSLSFQQYDQVIDQSRLSQDAQATAMIQRVGSRIQRAVEEYMRQKGLSAVLDGYEWEFHLIESDQVNAWCMPGGKVAFYTGILPICRDETGVAVVMGHEVAHAVAKHGAERMSHGMLAQLGGVALSQAIKDKPQLTQSLYMQAFAIGTQYGAMLPFSRQHESEADHMGLIFMAPPEWMSTHPSDQTRVRQLNEWMPEAMQYFRGN